MKNPHLLLLVAWLALWGILPTYKPSTAITNPLQGSRNVSAQSTTNVTVGNFDSRTCFTTEGASGEINFNLPTAAANLEYLFVGQAAQNLRVTASTGDTIRLYNLVTAAAGNVLAPAASAQGSTLLLVCINATEWIGIYFAGPWTVT